VQNVRNYLSERPTLSPLPAGALLAKNAFVTATYRASFLGITTLPDPEPRVPEAILVDSPDVHPRSKVPCDPFATRRLDSIHGMDGTSTPKRVSKAISA
jgi:hypothetical protein